MSSPHAQRRQVGPVRDRGGPARPIADLLPGALRALGVPSRAASRRVAVAWDQIADPAWRGRAAPARLQGGALVIAVESSPLREELAQFHAERLLAAMKSALPDDTIVSLRFEAGRAPPAPRPLEGTR